MWKNKHKEYWEGVVLPFQFGLRLFDTSPKSEIWNDMDVKEIVLTGADIIKYQRQQNKERYETYGYSVEWEGYKFCVLNGVQNSMGFDSVYNEDDFDGMLAYNHSEK